jgi:hypothetical protein
VTALQIHDRVLGRLGEDPADPTYWTSAEVYARIDEAQRFFVLLTLSLEKTTTYALAAATPFAHLLPTVTDFLLPLQLRIVGGARIRPGRLAEFDLLNDAWQKTEGAIRFPMPIPGTTTSTAERSRRTYSATAPTRARTSHWPSGAPRRTLAG